MLDFPRFRFYGMCNGIAVVLSGALPTLWASDYHYAGIDARGRGQ